MTEWMQENLDIMTKDGVVGVYSKLVVRLAEYTRRHIRFVSYPAGVEVIELLPVGGLTGVNRSHPQNVYTEAEDPEKLAREFINFWMIYEPGPVPVCAVFEDKVYGGLYSSSISELEMKLTLLGV